MNKEEIAKAVLFGIKVHPNKKQADIVYTVVHSFAGNCPMCGRTKDKRYTKRNINPNSNALFRSSKSSFTMRCKKCGLKYTMSWKSLTDALEKMMNQCEKDGKNQEADMYLSILMKLDKEVNTNGTHRFQPKEAR